MNNLLLAKKNPQLFSFANSRRIQSRRLSSTGISQKLKLHDWPTYDGQLQPLMNEKQLADLLDKSYQAECYQFDITMMHAYWVQFVTHDIIKSMLNETLQSFFFLFQSTERYQSSNFSKQQNDAKKNPKKSDTNFVNI